MTLELEKKICVLTEDPEEFQLGIWSLRYDSWYTSADKVKCNEIAELRKGDKILVTTRGQEVISVERYVDPLGDLDRIGE